MDSVVATVGVRPPPVDVLLVFGPRLRPGVDLPVVVVVVVADVVVAVGIFAWLRTAEIAASVVLLDDCGSVVVVALLTELPRLSKLSMID